MDLSPIRSPRRPPLSLSPGLGLDDQGNQRNRDGSPVSQLGRSHQLSPGSQHSRRSRSVSFILLRYLAIATVVILSYRHGCFLTHLDLIHLQLSFDLHAFVFIHDAFLSCFFLFRNFICANIIQNYRGILIPDYVVIYLGT